VEHNRDCRSRCDPWSLTLWSAIVQSGKLVIIKVATVLVALMSDESVGFGMLKAKVRVVTLLAHCEASLHHADALTRLHARARI
jgi:hypothetical protein